MVLSLIVSTGSVCCLNVPLLFVLSSDWEEISENWDEFGVKMC